MRRPTRRRRTLSTVSPGERYVVLDFETTGLSARQGARVIEVSAREVVDGKLGEDFATLIDPGEPIPAFVSGLTGITDDMLRGAPTPEDVFPRLLQFIGEATVVGHNIAFDTRFLHAEAQRVELAFDRSTLCTLLLSRRLFPGRTGYRLGGFVDELGLSLPARLHRASADTYVTAHLFAALRERVRLITGGRPVDFATLAWVQAMRLAAARRLGG